MDLFTKLVVLYVRLLNEGTESYRPVIAKDLGGEQFRILEMPEYRNLEEDWEFCPGKVVRRVEHKTYQGEMIHLAVDA